MPLFCAMKMQIQKIPTLLVASTVAVIGLVVFQLSWINYSRQLSEEIFNQRVCMAVCSTVENYGGGALCGEDGCSNTCSSASGETTFAVPADLAADSTFNAGLRKSLDFYQIDLEYRLALDHTATPDACNGELYQWAVSLPTDTGSQNAFINLEFPDKQAFMRGKMSFMLLATVLILLFMAAVLWFANWSLLKQKRLLQTNVDFFNNMAHEFRTPLTNVGLAINMVSKKHQTLKSEPLIDIIRLENSKLLNQVERVLHLASLENGDYALQKEQVHLRTLLESIAAEMAIQIEAKQGVVRLDAVPENIDIFGDRLHLGNVFRNLLDNALKYNKNAPDIRISAQEHQKGILIAVQDNGIGIPASECSMIFEKFQRVSRGDLHEQKGFGLGLAYVKNMVELHKGFIRVHSELQRGTCFEVFLPTMIV